MLYIEFTGFMVQDVIKSYKLINSIAEKHHFLVFESSVELRSLTD